VRQYGVSPDSPVGRRAGVLSLIVPKLSEGRLMRSHRNCGNSNVDADERKPSSHDASEVKARTAIGMLVCFRTHERAVGMS